MWDLRYPPPAVLEAEYSIAAAPGQPAALVPQGALVVPGDYEVRLTVNGRTLRQPLRVDPDPRRRVPAADLAALLAFQKEVEAVLARSTALAEAKREAEKRKQDLRALAGPRDEDPARVNSVLSALASQRIVCAT